MTTTQIVTFVVLAAAYILAEIFGDDNGVYKNRYPAFTYFIRIMTFTMAFVTAVVMVIYNNQLKSQHPCPQLEKVEDVYKIK